MIETVYKHVAKHGDATVTRIDNEWIVAVGSKQMGGYYPLIGGGWSGSFFPANMTEAEARGLYNCLHEFFGEKKA
jgi:hypothetical protein